ncbi:hypothetical protein RAA17_14855 [Komagataeibacter rhaeticus]|nr:hypothetical protein [Komagataeibacter rhaeticus]
MFGTQADVISDMTKIRLAGYAQDADPLAVLIGAIERQQQNGVIPRIINADVG